MAQPIRSEGALRTGSGLACAARLHVYAAVQRSRHWSRRRSCVWFRRVEHAIEGSAHCWLANGSVGVGESIRHESKPAYRAQPAMHNRRRLLGDAAIAVHFPARRAQCRRRHPPPASPCRRVSVAVAVTAYVASPSPSPCRRRRPVTVTVPSPSPSPPTSRRRPSFGFGMRRVAVGVGCDESRIGAVVAFVVASSPNPRFALPQPLQAPVVSSIAFNFLVPSSHPPARLSVSPQLFMFRPLGVEDECMPRRAAARAAVGA